AGTGHRISGKYADLLKRQTCPVYKTPCHRVLKNTAPAVLFYSSVTDISAPLFRSGILHITELSLRSFLYICRLNRPGNPGD
ncbi:TPA: hypothetical protein ACWCBK_005370, partial [Escherichia coli]